MERARQAKIHRTQYLMSSLRIILLGPETQGQAVRCHRCFGLFTEECWEIFSKICASKNVQALCSSPLPVILHWKSWTRDTTVQRTGLCETWWWTQIKWDKYNTMLHFVPHYCIFLRVILLHSNTCLVDNLLSTAESSNSWTQVTCSPKIGQGDKKVFTWLLIKGRFLAERKNFKRRV